MTTLTAADPRAIEVCGAIRAGRADDLLGLLGAHGLGGDARVVGSDGVSRTLLHVLTDWPGPAANGPATVAVLVAAGADVRSRVLGCAAHEETPLHWAASCDDVPVIDALLDAGADIDADGAVIAGGTAVTDAAAFGQWAAARRLVERGASTTLWEAAALGLVDRVTAALADGSGAVGRDARSITEAFWGACHGGQRSTAEILLAQGADVNWVGWDGLTPLEAGRRSGADDVMTWLAELGTPGFGRSSRADS